MDEGRNIIMEERRKVRAKDVKIIFTLDNNFNVTDLEGNLKYVGFVKGIEPHTSDYCTCKSFENGNTDIWIANHSIAYQCKHIICAHEELGKK
jgi:hypothetical protein